MGQTPLHGQESSASRNSRESVWIAIAVFVCAILGASAVSVACGVGEETTTVGQSQTTIDQAAEYIDAAANAATQSDLNPGGELPSPRAGHSMVYDPGSGMVILFGGFDVESEAALNDTWAYQPAANTWVQLDPGGELPSPRAGHSMVYDSGSGMVILFGGFDVESDGLFDDTWAYDPVADTWARLDPSGDLPGARGWSCMVYDSVGHKAVLVGGMGFDGYFDDTWAYDTAANTWTRLAGSASPSIGDSAMDATAKSLVRNAMTVIESAYVDLTSFDPATITVDVLTAIEPSITYIPLNSNKAATAPTATAATFAVNYFGTATTYAVGTVSESGRVFGAVVSKGPDGGNTFYVDGVAQDW